MLSTIARSVRGAVRREDVVARYGGEEFAVLLPNTTLEQATVVAENVRQAVSRIVMPFNGRNISSTLSGGLATIVADDTAEALIQRADAAMYRAKQSGRNRTCVQDGLQADAAGRADVPAELNQRNDSDVTTAVESSITGVANFGVYLQYEAISPQLAQTCQELRRYVEERATRTSMTEATATNAP
jgi:predicted signal transduction protein with EAL and GGDEF domain